MTENGTFIHSTAPSACVGSRSMHRSPARSSTTTRARGHFRGKLLYNARISSQYRVAPGSTFGSIDHKTSSTVRIDGGEAAGDGAAARAGRGGPTRRKKTHRVQGHPRGAAQLFYATEDHLHRREGQVQRSRSSCELLPASAPPGTFTDPETGEVIVKKNRKFTPRGDQEAGAGEDPRLALDVEETGPKNQRPRRGGREPARSCGVQRGGSPRRRSAAARRGIDQFQVSSTTT